VRQQSVRPRKRSRPPEGEPRQGPIGAAVTAGSGDSAEDPLLEVIGLHTSFNLPRGRVVAVDEVSFSLSRSRVLGIVGESGSGKSATALSLMRLIDPPGVIDPGGVIRFDGVDLLRLGEREMRGYRGKELGMIFQEPMTSLNPVLRIGDQIAETILAHEFVSRREAERRAVDLLEQVGIADPARRSRQYPFELSGGMRQRVMIAIAVACHPKLLIADEPTTALDVTIQAQILDLMADLRARTGMAMVIITHDLGVVAEISDEIAVMYAGKIVEFGPTRQVLDSPQHPYTEALIRSIPEPGAAKEFPLAVIPGHIPDPLHWPSGCRFAARCEHAFERCAELPERFGNSDQWSACWLREDAGLALAPGTPESL
jgi:oligopeptide/dipeptide ABC transporter ATP-binding protein